MSNKDEFGFEETPENEIVVSSGDLKPPVDEFGFEEVPLVRASDSPVSGAGSDSSKSKIKKPGEYTATDTFVKHAPQGTLLGHSDEAIGYGASLADPWHRLLNRISPEYFSESPSQILDKNEGKPDSSVLDDIKRAVTKGNPVKSLVPGYAYGNDQINLLLKKIGINEELPSIQSDPVYTGVRNTSREELAESAKQHPIPAFFGNMTGGALTYALAPTALTALFTAGKGAALTERALTAAANSIPMSVITGAGMTDADNLPQQLEDVKNTIADNGILSAAVPVAAAPLKAIGRGLATARDFVFPNYSVGKKIGEKGINAIGKESSKADSPFGKYYNSVADDVQNPINKSIEDAVNLENQGINAATLKGSTEGESLKTTLAQLKDLKIKAAKNISQSEKYYYKNEIESLQKKIDAAKTFIADEKIIAKANLIKNASEKGATATQDSLQGVKLDFKKSYDTTDDAIGDFIFDLNGPVSEFYNDPKIAPTLGLQPDKATAMAKEIQAYLIDPSSDKGGSTRTMFKDFVNGTEGKKAEFDNIINKHFPELAPYAKEVKSKLRLEQISQLKNSGNPELVAAGEKLEALNLRYSKYKPLFDKFLLKDEAGNIVSSPELITGVKENIDSRLLPDQRNKASDLIQLIDEIPDESVKSNILTNIEDSNVDKVLSDTAIQQSMADVNNYENQLTELKKELANPDRVNFWRAEDLKTSKTIEDKIVDTTNKITESKNGLEKQLTEFFRSGKKDRKTVIDDIIAMKDTSTRESAVSHYLKSGETLDRNSPLNQLTEAGQKNYVVGKDGKTLPEKIEELQDLLSLSKSNKEGFKGAFSADSLTGNIGRITAATTKSLAGIAGNAVGLAKHGITDNAVTNFGAKMGIGNLSKTPIVAPAINAYTQTVPKTDRFGNNREVVSVNGKQSIEELMATISGKPLNEVMELDSVAKAALQSRLVQMSPVVRQYLEQKQKDK